MAAEARRDLPVPLPVAMTGPDAARSSEYAVNLSPSGICLHRRDSLPIGSRVALSFELPGGGPRVEASARVVWVTREEERGTGTRFCEIGLRFEGLEASAGDWIERYVRQPFE